MASFMQKSMQWLGLVDDEFDEIAPYADPSAQAAPVAPRPAVRSTTNPRGMDTINLETPSTGVRALPREDYSGPSGITMTAPRTSVVRPVAASQVAQRVHVVEPTTFSDAQQIGDRLRVSEPVVITLQAVDHELARRIIDFCSGSAYALSAKMERIARNVFLLTPANVEVSAEERARLAERGMIRK
jgi:cell division inhibitor SepF